jgi:hypothetical protein
VANFTLKSPTETAFDLAKDTSWHTTQTLKKTYCSIYGFLLGISITVMKQITHATKE